MSKLCGFISLGASSVSVAEQLAGMTMVMLHTQMVVREHVFDGGGFALMQRETDDVSAMYQRPGSDDAIALAGCMVDPLSNSDGEVDTLVVAEDQLAALHDALAHRGTDLLARLNGTFIMAAYDAIHQQFTLANDRYGFAPLYTYRDERGIWFASEAKALLAVIGPQEFDWEACADFFYVGHMMREKTLWTAITAFGPGHVMRVAQGHVQIEQYHDFAQTRVMNETDVSTERLKTLSLQAARRFRRPDQSNTMLLSGGFDSRLILGSLHALGATPRVVTLEHGGEKGGADGQFARRIANCLGYDCEFRQTRPDFYSSKDCRDVFYMLDGMVPTWQLFISQVYAELAPSMGAIWDGMVLGVALGGGQEIEGGVRANMPEFLDMRSRNRPLLKHILTPEAFEHMDRTFIARIKGALAKVPPSSNQYLYFLLQSRTRRRIAPNPLQLFANKVAPRTPGADADFLDYILAIPPSQRLNHRIYTELFRTKFPLLVQTPVITGGKLIYFDRNIKSLRNEARKRIRATLKRNLRTINARGTLRRLTHRTLTHEERIFADVVIPVLKQTQFDRPFYQQTKLRRWFASYCAGDGRFHDLFTIVFYIEMWHLLFIDQDSPLLFNGLQQEAAYTERL